jgi:hypothetical protein
MIKYIHSSADTKHFNGVTIAYEIYSTHVKFAYSLVSKPDQYNKKIGRQLTKERFETSTSIVNQSYGIDTENMHGYISKEFIFTKIGIYNCFNKNIIETIMLTDIKNKSLISIICGIVSRCDEELYHEFN